MIVFKFAVDGGDAVPATAEPRDTFGSDTHVIGAVRRGVRG